MASTTMCRSPWPKHHQAHLFRFSANHFRAGNRRQPHVRPPPPLANCCQSRPALPDAFGLARGQADRVATGGVGRSQPTDSANSRTSSKTSQPNSGGKFKYP